MEKKPIILSILLLIFFFVFPSAIAAEMVAGHSATITYNITQKDEVSTYFRKKLVIKRVLEKYDSPMVDAIDDFMEACKKYNLDCYLLPSIAGIESTFGRFIYEGSYNPFGWGRGLIIFKNWGQAIDIVGQGLRENYINKGADTVEKIGVIYCEGNSWAGKVKYFMNQFEAEEDKLDLFLGQNQVKL